MAENRLARETSPYLLQHKDNPVDWRPWGAEALEAARQSDKPILLSVGYAACHWCHVMAHESFENPDIAALMNQHFVNIKVDREERPDIDAIYMNALHLMGEHGGWPLTMFLTPDGEPFWGGTYFPPEPRWGRPSFPQVLQSIVAAYRDKPEDVAKNVAALREGLQKLAQPEGGGTVFRHSSQIVRPHCRAPPARGRSAQRRHRHGAEIPAIRHFRAAVAGLEAHAATSLQGCRDAHADDDRPGRDLRPSRRRLGALFGRCALARAAFREDAVRQRRADRPDVAGLAGDARPALRDTGRRDDRLAPARDDASAGRVLQQPRRRQRGRGGKILRLVRGRDRRRAREPGRAVQAVLRRDPRRELGGEKYPEPPRASLPRRRRDRIRAGSLPRDVAPGPRPACAPR